MRRYQEMTYAEKETMFPRGVFNYHMYWVLCDGQRVGYVWQVTRAGAGRNWWAQGHTQAWQAYDTLGNQMVFNGDGGWLFPSKSAAATALLGLHERAA